MAKKGSHQWRTSKPAPENSDDVVFEVQKAKHWVNTRLKHISRKRQKQQREIELRYSGVVGCDILEVARAKRAFRMECEQVAYHYTMRLDIIRLWAGPWANILMEGAPP